MSKKDNIRSFRYSSEVAAILEAQEGKSLNDKFENLVLTCFYKLPDVQKQLEQVNKEIARKRQRMEKMGQEITRVGFIMRDLEDIQEQVASMADYFKD